MNGLVGVGDNTADIYIDRDLQFPGGNTVNVAVFARRQGLPSAYLGAVGNDRRGDWIKACLQMEHVDTSKIKTLPIENAWSCIRHIQNDRQFAGSFGGASRQLVLDAEDYSYLSHYELAHSSIYSGLESHLEQIRKVVGRLSFDYSDNKNWDYIQATAAYLDIAFLSGSELTKAECLSLMQEIHALGVSEVIITRGAEGVLALVNGENYEQEIVPAKVVDTLGAGDGFISGYLVSRIKQQSIKGSLRSGVDFAAKVCAELGGFGHPIELTVEEKALVLDYLDK